MTALAFALGSVVAFVLAAVGARRVYREGLAIKRHFAAYAMMPIRADVDVALGRVAVAQRRIDTLAALLARAERALAEIASARSRIAATAKSVVRRDAASRPRAGRSPGN